MKIRLIDPQNALSNTLKETSSRFSELDIGRIDEAAFESYDGADVVVAAAGSSEQEKVVPELLGYRLNPKTCLTPCLILEDRKDFERHCLWPHLSIDRFIGAPFDPDALGSWLCDVSEWQQKRMNFSKSNSLSTHSPLEILTSLALRKATGKLTLLDDSGGEGSLGFLDGHFIGASMGHLSDLEGFYEFFCLKSGWYNWDLAVSQKKPDLPRLLSHVIHKALSVLREANLLYHFLPDFRTPLRRTGSESALDDGGIDYYAGQKEIYDLIDGKLSAEDILSASPLSRPRTMSCLARWFSMLDIEAGGAPACSAEASSSACRLLIVDDSPLLCKALEAAFGQDPRFSIVGVAHDGLQALDLIAALKPDVVTLDIQMPRMDGLTTLKHIMIRTPRPVVILSAFTRETSQLTYNSFKYGAVDVVTKPAAANSEPGRRAIEELKDRVAQACAMRIEAARVIRRPKRAKTNDMPLPKAGQTTPSRLSVILCGSGGFPLLLKLLLSIRAADEIPPAIVSLAMPDHVIKAMVPNLAKDCTVSVRELPPEGGILEPGVFYLHSIERAIEVCGTEGGAITITTSCGECPSERVFDRLLASAATLLGEGVATFLISGTGEDGIEGMQRIALNGGRSFALSHKACLKPDLSLRVLESKFASEVSTIGDMARLIGSGQTREDK